jgi:hypothetical protein
MLKITRWTLFVLFTYALCACECFVTSKGVILDKSSKEPITLAKVRHVGDKMPDYFPLRHTSDASGHYQIMVSSYWLFGCPDLKLSFSKFGYRTRDTILIRPSSSDTIYLEKVKK